MVVVLCTSSYDAYGNTCMKFYEHILKGFKVVERTRFCHRNCYLIFGFEGRIWDLIVSVPDHCLSFYFTKGHNKEYQYKSYGSCTLHVV